MSEHLNKQDVLNAINDVMNDRTILHKFRALRLRISRIPTADVEEVVRCRDCIHCEAGAYTLLYCEYFDWGINADDFCSYGERKDEK